jgi:hypothetical protein
MAHAGTQTGLTTQPATTTPRGLWQAIIAAILVLALAAGMVAVTSNLVGKTTAVPTTDHTYQIPSQPGVDVHKVVGHKGALIYQ